MYKFREGYPAPKGLAAERAAKELELIRKRRGTLTSAVIVEESRNKDSPLHPAFEWDDSAAAQKYRERQAGTLVRAIVLVEEKRQDEPKPVFTLTVKDEQRQYMPSEIVVKDAEMYSYSLSRLNSLLAAAERSATALMDMHDKLPAKQRKAVMRASKYIGKASQAVAGV